MVLQEIKDDHEQYNCKGMESTRTAGKPREEGSMDTYENQKLPWTVIKTDDIDMVLLLYAFKVSLSFRWGSASRCTEHLSKELQQIN